MSDIVERLRRHDGHLGLLVDEAASEIARLKSGLRRLSEQDYDAGYSPEDYARAVLDGYEPTDDEGAPKP
jgi:hypothetical protein